VSNAVKYSDPAKADPYVAIEQVDSAAATTQSGSTPTCTIAVRDNGIGIPEEDQAAVFDRFFRAHAHRDDELGVSGTGLGLAIVHDCVQALRATIRCESRSGSGTTFFVTLPMTPAGA